MQSKANSVTCTVRLIIFAKISGTIAEHLVEVHLVVIMSSVFLWALMSMESRSSTSCLETLKDKSGCAYSPYLCQWMCKKICGRCRSWFGYLKEPNQTNSWSQDYLISAQFSTCSGIENAGLWIQAFFPIPSTKSNQWDSSFLLS